MLSRKEIRDEVLDTTQQDNTQIGSLVNSYINQTLHEIQNPGWAFRKNFHHTWSFLRGKTSFATVASTSDYVLPREIDKIALMRQTTTPIKLNQIPDELFFEIIPDPTATGNPRYYRTWENEGVATRLAAADTIDIVSGSTSDAGSSALTITVLGYVSGILTRETIALNGTSTVNGSTTFDAREIWISKQTDTTGVITVTENSGGTTLVTLGPDERAPKFKVVTLYPIPSSAITISLEYYSRIPTLENDSDVPIFNGQYHYVVTLGTLAKVYRHLNKETQMAATRADFRASVRSMVAADMVVPDLIEHLTPVRDIIPFIIQYRSEATIATG